MSDSWKQKKKKKYNTEKFSVCRYNMLDNYNIEEEGSKVSTFQIK